jgi:hypothetical protein
MRQGLEMKEALLYGFANGKSTTHRVSKESPAGQETVFTSNKAYLAMIPRLKAITSQNYDQVES